MSRVVEIPKKTKKGGKEVVGKVALFAVSKSTVGQIIFIHWAAPPKQARWGNLRNRVAFDGDHSQ